MPAPLGIKNGELWAYKETLKRGPLVQVKVLDAGTHYQASIRLRRIDDGETLWTTRHRLPCKWDDRDTWLEAHPEFVTSRPEVSPEDFTAEPAPVLIPRLGEVDLERIRSIVKDEFRQHVGLPRLAFSVKELSYSVGLSDTQIYNHIRRNDLVPKYSGTKMIITLEEAMRFVAALPDEEYGPL